VFLIVTLNTIIKKLYKLSFISIRLLSRKLYIISKKIKRYLSIFTILKDNIKSSK